MKLESRDRRDRDASPSNPTPADGLHRVLGFLYMGVRHGAACPPWSATPASGVITRDDARRCDAAGRPKAKTPRGATARCKEQETSADEYETAGFWNCREGAVLREGDARPRNFTLEEHGLSGRHDKLPEYEAKRALSRSSAEANSVAARPRVRDTIAGWKARPQIRRAGIGIEEGVPGAIVDIIVVRTAQSIIPQKMFASCDVDASEARHFVEPSRGEAQIDIE